MNPVIVFGILLSVIAIDFYLIRGILKLFKGKKKSKRIALAYLFFVAIPAVILILLFVYMPGSAFKGITRSVSLTYFAIDLITRLLILIFFLIDDLQYFSKKMIKKNDEDYDPSRKQFIKKVGLATAILPVTGFSFGIIKGAHDYEWFKYKVPVKGLPKAFHGLRIAQLSDIHSGSFFNKTAVEGGIEMFMKENADMVFFTGDLVNSRSSEVNDYFDIFKKIDAPLGVYSILGNHDYGDYTRWPSMHDKRQNLLNLYHAHEAMGWKLLLNQHHLLEVDGEVLPIIGVENWGKGRFQQYGDIPKAIQGIEDIPNKILLSHDPSHWDAVIRPEHPDIILTCSGHTHGFQMGVETPFFRWSPSQYLYKQWAGLYQVDGQYLNVNRGFGFIGYPGRVGIAPEMSLIELQSV